MLEVVILSLFVGSLGLQATGIGLWKRQQQIILEAANRSEEEEDILTRYDPQDSATATESHGSMSPRQPPLAEPTPQLYGSLPQTNAEADLPKDPRLAGWEFKIVRANRDWFRDPIVFQRLCREEAEAGWILLEKLDDRRVRFKRPLALREIINPDYLSHDPYRCHYGSSFNLATWLGPIAFLSVVFSSAYLGYALVKVTLSKKPTQPLPSIPSLPLSPAPPLTPPLR